MLTIAKWFSLFTQDNEAQTISREEDVEKVEEAIDAIKSRNLQALNQLLSMGLNANARDKKGFSLIHITVLHGRPAYEDEVLTMINLLISYGANVNAYYVKDQYGPLTTAVRRKLPEVVDLLLEHGADSELQVINHNKTALDYAKEMTDENDERGHRVLQSFAKHHLGFNAH